MPKIGTGIVGGGYMGKAHAVAMSAVGAVFGTRLQIGNTSSTIAVAWGLFERAVDRWPRQWTATLRKALSRRRVAKRREKEGRRSMTARGESRPSQSRKIRVGTA